MRTCRPTRRNSGSPSSSSSNRIWRLMADCETCSFRPQAVNDPVSAMACNISSWRRSMGEGLHLSERDAVSLRSDERHDHDANHAGRGQDAHRLCICEMLAEYSFDVRDARRDEHAQLIGEPREEATQ